MSQALAGSEIVDGAVIYVFWDMLLTHVASGKRAQVDAGKKTVGSEIEMMTKTEQRRRRQLNTAYRRAFRESYRDAPEDQMPWWCKKLPCLPDPNAKKARKKW